MRRALAVLLGILVGLEPAMLGAQQAVVPAAQASPSAAPSAQTAPAPGAPSIEAMGLSFERIKRQLGERPPSASKTPLVLNYYVEVTGVAPAIVLFTPQELAAGPVPGGPPTHSDMLDHHTRQEFKSPPFPVSTLAIMGVMKLIEMEKNRLQRQRIEAARKRRDDEERERQRRIQESIVVQPKSGPGTGFPDP